jgi:hypothetical protein
MLLKTLLFALALLGIGVFSTLALAMESKPASSTAPSIDYALPYPGLLPDHPLFFIKTLRDKILLLLITSQNRRVEFNQLTADKYVAMAVFLAQEKKSQLAISTLDTAISYAKETQIQVGKLPPTKSDEVGNLKHHFSESLKKYQQVLLEQKLNFSSDSAARWQADITQIAQISADFQKTQ